MPPHHPFGPSSIRRAELCPGSISLSESAREQGIANAYPKEAAAEGTLLHSLLPGYKSLEGLEDYQIAWVKSAREWIESKILEYTTGIRYYEHTMALFSDSGVITFGTADVVSVDRNSHVGLVLELKFGRDEPDQGFIQRQLQLLICMLTVENPNLDKVLGYGFHVPSGTEFRAPTEISPVTIMKIISIIQEAKKNPHYYNPSPPACRYCSGRAICPALIECKLPGTLEIKAPPKQPLEIAPSQWARAIDAAKFLSIWSEDVQRAAKSLPPELLKAAGYELKVTDRRKITDVEGMAGALRDAELYDQSAIMGSVTVSITKLEKATSKVLAEKAGITQREAGSRLAEILAPFVSTSKSKELKKVQS